MRNERLTILVTREEKRALASLAKRRRISVGELVRTAVATATRPDAQPAADETRASPDQVAAIERAAEAALDALQRAASSLDRAEVELARTRAHFDANAGEVRDGGTTPRALYERALVKLRGAGE